MPKVFSVYDSKAEAYLQPFFAQATGIAVRSFQTAANDEKHEFNRYAGDYTLFEIGTYDERTGTMEALKTYVNLGLALEMITYQPEHQQAAGQAANTNKPTLAEMHAHNDSMPKNKQANPEDVTRLHKNIGR